MLCYSFLFDFVFLSHPCLFLSLFLSVNKNFFKHFESFVTVRLFSFASGAHHKNNGTCLPLKRKKIRGASVKEKKNNSKRQKVDEKKYLLFSIARDSAIFKPCTISMKSIFASSASGNDRNVNL